MDTGAGISVSGNSVVVLLSTRALSSMIIVAIHCHQQCSLLQVCFQTNQKLAKACEQDAVRRIPRLRKLCLSINMRSEGG